MIAQLTAKELRTFFYSPAAWLVLVVFSAHAVICLCGIVDFAPAGMWVSQIVFSIDRIGFFSALSSYLFLYTALLTMGLMSAEYGEGGIKLLLSSPVRILDIVLGKYAAVLIYGLLLCAIVGAIGVMVGLFIIQSMDVPLFLAGLFTFFLLYASYTAIGLFVSSLTSYPLIAAVGTVAALFILQNFTAGLATDSMPFFLKQLLMVWLNPLNHVTSGYNGLINTADVLYFLILIVLALGLAVLRLQSLRRPQSPWVLGLKYAGATAAAIVIGTLSYDTRYFHYFDFTGKRWWTPTTEFKEALQALERPLRITEYFNVLEKPRASHPLVVHIRGSSMREASRHHFNLQHQPYYRATERLDTALQSSPDEALKDMSQMAERTQKELFNRSSAESGKSVRELALDAAAHYGELDFNEFMDPASIDALMSSSGADIERADFLLLESGERRTVIPLDTILTDIIMRRGVEQVMTAALKRLSSDPSKVGFLSGHGERDPFGKEERDYNSIVRDMRESLMLQGFDVVKLPPEAAEITSDVSILVIADPRQALSPAQLETVRRFRERGGNLLILGEPEHAQIINDIVRDLGVELSVSAAASPEDPRQKYAQIVPQAIKRSEHAAEGLLRRGVIQNDPTTPEAYVPDLLGPQGQGQIVAMPTRSVVSWKTGTAYEIQPLLQQPQDSPAAGQPVMVALQAANANTVGGQQRIVIGGDADFMSNSAEGIGYENAFKPRGAGSNSDFIMSLFKYLSHDARPIDMHREYYSEKLLLKGKPPNGSPPQAYGPWNAKVSAVRRNMIAVLVIPLLIAGIVVVGRRRRS